MKNMGVPSRWFQLAGKLPYGEGYHPHHSEPLVSQWKQPTVKLKSLSLVWPQRYLESGKIEGNLGSNCLAREKD